MPFYDFTCENGHDTRDAMRSIARRNDPCECGAPITHVYRGMNMIADEIPGGMWIENLGPKPVKVYSKSQLRHEAEMRGLSQHVKHVGEPGSDKSRFTTRWL